MKAHWYVEKISGVDYLVSRKIARQVIKRHPGVPRSIRTELKLWMSASAVLLIGAILAVFLWDSERALVAFLAFSGLAAEIALESNTAKVAALAEADADFLAEMIEHGVLVEAPEDLSYCLFP